MIIQRILLLIEIFSNHLIILKKEDNLYCPFNWHKDCSINKLKICDFVDNREELLFNT
jgi:hypothetical protein